MTNPHSKLDRITGIMPVRGRVCCCGGYRGDARYVRHLRRVRNTKSDSSERRCDPEE